LIPILYHIGIILAQSTIISGMRVFLNAFSCLQVYNVNHYTVFAVFMVGGIFFSKQFLFGAFGRQYALKDQQKGT
jgi:hypothetical protein